jgi:hypothetical protein
MTKAELIANYLVEDKAYVRRACFCQLPPELQIAPYLRINARVTMIVDTARFAKVKLPKVTVKAQPAFTTTAVVTSRGQSRPHSKQSAGFPSTPTKHFVNKH